MKKVTLKIKLFISLSLLLVFSTKNVHAQNWSWAKAFTGSNIDYASRICSDNQGNVFFTGNFFSPTLTVGSTILQNNSIDFGNDIYFGKASSSGNILWVKNFGGRITDWGIDVACDPSGNVYLCGTTGSDTLDFGNNVKLQNFNINQNYFVVKFNSSGVAQWVKTSKCDIGSEALAIDVDGDGGVYVTGTLGGLTNGFNNSLTFDTLIYNTGASDNCFLVKFDTDGAFQYVKRVEGTTSGSFYGPKNVALDGQKRVYMAGASMDPTDATLQKDMFVAKYSKLGDIIWKRYFGGNAKDNIESVDVDNNGNIYIVGEFESTVLNIGSYTLTGSTASNFNRFAAKLDNDGNVLWAKKITNSTGNWAYDIVVDNDGNSYICGSGIDTVVFSNNMSYSDIFVIKLNTQGAAQWTMKAGDGFLGAGFENARGICLGTNGDIFILADGSASTCIFGNVSANATGAIDIFLAKIAMSGSGSVHSYISSPDINIYQGLDGKIIVKNSQNDKTFYLYNLEGKLVFSQNIAQGTNTIEFTGASGIYVSKITDQTGSVIHTGKIVINNTY